MTFAEQTAVAGTTAKTNNNRYGDYSHTSLDPDGITFWHTGMYQNTGNKTRIFSFKITIIKKPCQEKIGSRLCQAFCVKSKEGISWPLEFK